MQAEEDFRSRLRDDLHHRPAPPVGALVPDALSAGRRMRRRRQTMRAVGGTVAVAAVAVGSVTVAGVFGSHTSTAAIGPGALGGSASTAASWPVRVPASWTVPPAAAVGDPAYVTPQAIIAETRQLLPAGTSTSAYSGNYGYGRDDPREWWAVDGQMNVTTAKGPTEVDVMLHKLSGFPDDPCGRTPACAAKRFSDGTRIVLQHDWSQPGGMKGAYVWVVRKDGMSVQVSVRDQSQWTDDQLFALASCGAFGSAKMDKAFVAAAATISGSFGSVPPHR
jgi:hypothetical protein